MKKYYLTFFALLFANIFHFSFAQNNVTEIPTTIKINPISAILVNLSTSTASTSPVIPEEKYVQIVNSCKFNFAGTCVSVRNGPSKKAKKIFGARNGVVLKVSEKITNLEGDWYKIIFDEKLIYPERVKSDMYVNASYTVPVLNVLPETYDSTKTYDDSKSIVVDLSEQKLYAYQNNTLYMTTKVSTGLSDTPTLPGEYYLFYKTPSRYMQGPIDRAGLIKNYFSNSTNTPTSTRNYILSTKAYATDSKVKDYYDLPGVPYTMYFDSDGSAIHGAYWHNNFGKNHSHGCVNLPLKDSEKLYKWAGVGTAVIIRK